MILQAFLDLVMQREFVGDDEKSPLQKEPPQNVENWKSYALFIIESITC